MNTNSDKMVRENSRLVNIIGLLLVTFLAALLFTAACETPTPPPPTSPIATPPMLPRAMEIEPRITVSEVVTGEIVILWQDEALGIYPKEIISSAETTTTLYVDMQLRLEDGSVLSQTVETGLSGADAPGTGGQFDGIIPYEWQDVPAGTHGEYSRPRWEIESSDVVVIGSDSTYVPYKETIYGVTVTDGVLVEADAEHFAFYRTVEVRQVFYTYLPIILSHAD
jgi:hypothetical protein